MFYNYERVAAIIDLDAIAHNMRQIKTYAKKNEYSPKILATIKADAYGHGAVEVAKVALYNGANILGVAILDEALELASHNIHIPLLILGHTNPNRLEQVVSNGFIQTVFSYETASVLSNIAQRLNKKAIIHIKIDTGMGRIGFLPNENSLKEITKISHLPNITIDGIYSHFSFADGDTEFTNIQHSLFTSFVQNLEQNNVHIQNKHISNSAAFINHTEFHMDIVRAGIILYGLSPFGDNQSKISLKPAMSLKTNIIHIKQVDAGFDIGYGRSHTTNRQSTIATIPVGYADGYMRAMSSRGRVLVGGEYAPVVGRVCMDQFMIDITQISKKGKNISVGDEVVLMGKQGSNEIPAGEIAEICGTISYEIVCLIGKRVPRLYIKNGELLKTISYI